MKRIIIISLISTLLATVVFSQQNERRIRNRSEISPPRISKLLNLSEEQSKTFNEYRYQSELEKIDLQTEIKRNHVELQKMLADGIIDNEKILNLTSENSELQGQMKSTNVKMWLDIYNILNEEQKEKWMKLYNHFIKNGKMRGRFESREMMGKGKRNRNSDQ